LTLTGTMAELVRAGFVEHFGVRSDELRSFDSGRTFAAGQVVIREYHRFEGVSDPDDMSIVYAIEGEGGVRGTLVDAFGVYSDPAVSAFLDRVPIRGATPFASGAAGPGRVFDEPGTVREPSRFGSYHHGFQVPVPSDPWHDEGGESGPVT
jgi:hypothetical protein